MDSITDHYLQQLAKVSSQSHAPKVSYRAFVWSSGFKLLILLLLLLYIFIIIIIIELTHSKTIQENTVEIEPQPVALDFKNLSQYSSCSK